MKELSGPTALSIIIASIFFCSLLFGFIVSIRNSRRSSRTATERRSSSLDEATTPVKPETETLPRGFDELRPTRRNPSKCVEKNTLFDPLNGSELIHPATLVMNHPRLGRVKVIVNVMNARFYSDYGPRFFSNSLMSMNTHIWCFDQTCLVCCGDSDRFTEMKFLDFYNTFLENFQIEDLGFNGWNPREILEGDAESDTCYWCGEIRKDVPKVVQILSSLTIGEAIFGEGTLSADIYDAHREELAGI